MKQFALNLPLNSVSFGQISINLLRETFKKGLEPSIFPIGGAIDLRSEEPDEPLSKWINESVHKSVKTHSRSTPIVKLWHLNGSLESFSNKQFLFSFYELDKPTEEELNIGKNNHLIFSSKYTCDVFKEAGVDCDFVPLGFDVVNFRNTGKEYFNDGRITFNLVGKFEKRKHHARIINAWAKEFGNDTKYFLQCALYNKFLKPEQNNAAVATALQNRKYPNIQFLNYMDKNTMYNEFLNAGDIVIGMSGGEGWGLPEFHSVGLGKHAVILNAHAYKGWANTDNSILVEPSGKIPAYDDVFFNEGQPWNQGSIFDFKEEDFIEGCYKAIERCKNNRVNTDGLKLQDEFTYSNTLDKILSLI